MIINEFINLVFARTYSPNRIANLDIFFNFASDFQHFITYYDKNPIPFQQRDPLIRQN